MNRTIPTIALLSLSAGLAAAEPPSVETYLHSGELVRGEQALEAALLEDPDDDRTRFGLGVLKVVRAVERFGQSLHEYGAKPAATRLPIPENPNPAPVDYRKFRRVLDDLRRDLVEAEATLAEIEDDEVTLPLRLAHVRVDLDGDGEPSDEFLEVLQRGFRQRSFPFLEENPDFRVGLDRGDVSWLRGYCHLVCGVLDGMLAFDGEREFERSAERFFANPAESTRNRDDEPDRAREGTARVVEPLRLARCRRHLVRVCELNRETWRHVRRESDDDHEWLPHPGQRGVLGLPVKDEMIDAWLAMAEEVRATLEGERAFLKIFIEKDGRGLDLKPLLDDPPTVWGGGDFPRNLPDDYFTDARDIDLNILFIGLRAFGNSALGYAIWFN